VTVQWRPYQLRPNTPLEGRPKEPLVVTATSNSRVHKRLADFGKSVGINFTGKTDRYPNTLACHVALDYAAAVGGSKAQDELAELLFKANFTDGIFLSAANIEKLAAKVPGLTQEGMRAALADKDLKSKVRAEAAHFARAGVSGVPFFIVNDKPAFSGAQPPDRIRAAFAKL